jgi:hypothetical protein
MFGIFGMSGILLAPHAVRAQEPAVGGSAAEAGAEGESTPPPAPGTPQAQERGVSVEKLPGSAFPDRPGAGIFGGPWSFTKEPVRGIWGGSLWLGTFHGLQWPYMPRTGIGVSGSAWIDTGYEQITRPNDMSHKNSIFWLQQGRAVLRVTPTYSENGFFVQAQAELVANKEQKVAQPQVADTDDLWIKFGQWHKWDVQVGRYESWELYHLGMGLDLNTLERIGAEDGRYSGQPATELYLVRFGDVRPAGVGNVALHLFLTNFLRLELLGLVGNETQGLNNLGTRSSVILDFGIIKIKGGGEYSKSRGSENIFDPMNPAAQIESRQTKFQRGFGGSVQLVLNPWFEAGVNVARGLQDETAETSGAALGKGSYTVTSIGGFANARLMEALVVGVGLNRTNKVDTDFQSATMRVGNYANTQGFGAIQYVLARQLFIKVVFGFSKADFQPSQTLVNFSNTMLSGRIRLMYLF